MTNTQAKAAQSGADSRKIFDARPSAEAMAARCKRDRVDPASLVEVITPHGGYFIRCFGLATTKTEIDHTGTHEVPAFYLYSARRDGRVSNGWNLKRSARDVEVVS
jgi:hypothetical protein